MTLEWNVETCFNYILLHSLDSHVPETPATDDAASDSEEDGSELEDNKHVQSESQRRHYVSDSDDEEEGETESRNR